VGGTGSTRWACRGDYMPPLTIHEAIDIQIQGIFRELRPLEGESLEGQIGCSRAGPVDFTIDATSYPLTVFLRFSESLRAAVRTIPADTSVWVHPTLPAYGGERWWFVCPACGRHCGAIYCLPRGHFRLHGFDWACRRCQKLVYPSQREGKGERALRRLRKVLRRAGETWSPYCPPRVRPKGMHRKTYRRLQAQAFAVFSDAAATRRTARVLREGALWA
jgi:hypothetical protein